MCQRFHMGKIQILKKLSCDVKITPKHIFQKIQNNMWIISEWVDGLVRNIWPLWQVNITDVEITSQGNNYFFYCHVIFTSLSCDAISATHATLYIDQFHFPRTKPPFSHFSHISSSLLHSFLIFSFNPYSSNLKFLIFSLFQLSKVRHCIFILFFLYLIFG